MHFPEFRRGGVHARIGSLGRSLRSSSISNSKQPSLQDRIVNQIQIHDLIELWPAGLRFPMHVYEDSMTRLVDRPLMATQQSSIAFWSGSSHEGPRHNCSLKQWGRVPIPCDLCFSPLLLEEPACVLLY